MSRSVMPGKFHPLTLILGGARSGKSRHAEALLTRFAPPWTYIATAQAFDDEMRDRIAEHRARPEAGWRTIEAPLDLPGALGRPGPGARGLPDAVAHQPHPGGSRHQGRHEGPRDAALTDRAEPVILVSNEVGLGIVPDNALARRFRDEAGVLHQRLAAQADSVLLMVAGLLQ